MSQASDSAEVGAPERIDLLEVPVEGFAPVDLYQRREKIFTRFVGGFYQRLRFFTGWPLLLGYLATPWLYWNGRQAVLFDLPARQFHVFTTTFWPEDLWLLGWILILSAFALFAVTTVVGRLWCGYTCPQTVWTAVFMGIEQFFEGSRNQRIRLDQAPMSWNKLRRRGAKHGAWLAVALLTGVTFVGYFTPIRELTVDLASANLGGWAAFWTLFFTAATYGNAGWLREQVCTYMCPYARFQSAMIDADSLVVTYDAARGEPRGLHKQQRAEAAGNPQQVGDCVDCSLCVQVCPTGIDIRNGLQYECIGCAHCIDACNQVMTKLNLPKGLIRYSTERALKGGQTRWLRGRSIGYAAVTAVMGVALTVGIVSRTPFSFELTRDRSSLFQQDDAGLVRNQYDLKVANKGAEPLTASLKLMGGTALVLETATQIELPPRSSRQFALTLRAPAASASSQPVAIELCVRARSLAAKPVCEQDSTTFFGPSS